MTGQEALELIDRLLQTSNQQGLSDLQSAIILAVWKGETYQIVADRLSYEVDYIKQVSARLWKQIAPIVGEDVCKRNFQSVLRRYQNTHVVPSNNRMQDWEEAIAVAHFYERLSRSPEFKKLLEILEALHERSLIEVTETVLSQQPAVIEDVTKHFMQSIERELSKVN